MDYKEKVIALLNSQELSDEQKRKLEKIFPELKESEDEDEKIRKYLVNFVKLNEEINLSPEDADKMLAWLEKQSEKDKEILILKDQIESLHAAIEAVKETHRIELKKQGENSVCKVKIGETYKCIASPRYTCFRMGDIYHVKDNFIAELINTCSSCFVLLEKQGEKPIIEMKTPEESLGIDSDTYNKIVDECIYGEQKPVDKVEPDILIEESYQQQADDLIDMVTENPAWSEEDELIISAINALINMAETETGQWYYNGFKKVFYFDIRQWLKSLKDRVLPQPKQEWSEEDERKCNNIIALIEGKTIMRKDIKGLINWLKYLRPQNRWKPSEEQMKGIECAIKTLRYQLNVGDKRLNSLYDDLKKLK